MGVVNSRKPPITTTNFQNTFPKVKSGFGNWSRKNSDSAKKTIQMTPKKLTFFPQYSPLTP